MSTRRNQRFRVVCFQLRRRRPSGWRLGALQGTLEAPAIWLLLVVGGLLSFAARGVQADEFELVERLKAIRPTACDQFDASRVKRLRQASDELERWAAGRVWDRREPDGDAILTAIEQLIVAKQGVDSMLDETLKLRGGFVKLAQTDQRATLRYYLQFTSLSIDLSGRLRYLMSDALRTAAFDLETETDAKDVERLLDLLLKYRVPMGAAVMTYVLYDPPPGVEGEPYSHNIKVKALQLISRTRQVDAMPDLASFVLQETNSPDLTVVAAEVIRRLGIPQDPIPGQDRTLPRPAITAAQLKEVLDGIDVQKLRPKLQPYHRRVQEELAERVREGIVGDVFRFGEMELRKGDWLLMRNPSPYNLFTDLSPGLFTHVGVVAVRKYDDGIRRFVIVDLPERGDSVPATNVDTYLLRTLHYFFLRHERAEVATRMGDAAEQMIGNESIFDLTFQTDRVREQKGEPLKGRRIYTYCAGFLLICALETDAAEEEFFPIQEVPAGGNCSENLKKLGLSIGDHFVSPTGAVFSPRLKLVGARDPMYSPDREVKEAIYDHFAKSMVSKTLTPSQDVRQALRQKVAELARFNPWLARFLARASNVNQNMDLVSAAKAAAAIETLDEIANSAASEYDAARIALLAGPLDQLRDEDATSERRKSISEYRERHAELFKRLVGPGLSPRDLRIGLVDYYSKWGRDQIDSRFFPDSPPKP